ncbi:phage tail protein [Pseudomonas putida]|uniref:phage tail protein n=1 Tax=Pseudomonas putida TaxID=303 RepID=UPI003D979A5E
MLWYKTGTVSVVQNSNAVIGTNTAFISNARVGDAFRGPDGAWYEVTNIASDTALAISPNYQGASNAAGIYALAPMQGYVKDSADALRSLVNQYGAKLAALGTTGNYDILPVTKGGTGGTDQAGARSGIGAAKSGSNNDITSLAGLTNALSVAQGGTGVATIAALLSALQAAGAYGKSNAVGTTSQSGGVPSGAIIERGNNSNGDYVRYADGTQICWKRIATDISSTPIGGIFGSGAFGAGPYPAGFIEAPKVVHSGYIASGNVNAMWSGCYTSPTQNSWGNYQLLSAGSYGAGYIDVLAIGRWF